MTLKTLDSHFVGARQYTHAAMREFNGFISRSGAACTTAKRGYTRLRNRVPPAAAVSLNGMHIYGVAGWRVYTSVGGFEGCRRCVLVGCKKGRESARAKGEGKIEKRAIATAPSTCLAVLSGVTNLNGTLHVPIAGACLLI